MISDNLVIFICSKDLDSTVFKYFKWSDDRKYLWWFRWIPLIWDSTNKRFETFTYY